MKELGQDGEKYIVFMKSGQNAALLQTREANMDKLASHASVRL